MRLVIHLTHEVDSEAQAEELYEEIKGELKKYDALHVNGQIVDKFKPSHPPGTPEEGPPP